MMPEKYRNTCIRRVCLARARAVVSLVTVLWAWQAVRAEEPTAPVDPARFVEEPGFTPAEMTPQVVLALAYSPDGKLLATAGEDNTIRLRDVASRRVRSTLSGHGDAVTSLGVLTRRQDAGLGRLRQARQDSGTCHGPGANRRSRGTRTGSSRSRFRPTARPWPRAATTSWSSSGTWHGARRSPRLRGHGASVRSVAFSPDGETLASGGSDRTVRLWDVAGRKEPATLKGHKGAIRAVAYSPDGTLLASASEDGTIKLWDVAGDRRRSGRRWRATPTSSAAWPSRREAGPWRRGAGTRLVKFWDVASGNERFTLKAHSDAVTALAFAPVGGQLATAGQDKQVKLWVPGEAAISARWVVKPYDDNTRFAAFSPDGRTLASGASENRVVLWDVATGKEKAVLGRHANRTACGAFSPDGRQLASGSFVAPV